MSAPYIVPFNNEPIAISVKTGSYTIPSGRFAKITVNIEGTGTFTINGVLAFRGVQSTLLSSLEIYGSNLYARNIKVDIGSNDGKTGNLAISTTDQKPLVAEIFAPAGTAINGTGVWRAVVQEYYSIS